MSKKITNFEDYLYSTFIDMDFNMYSSHTKKQYIFNSSIDITTEFSQDFFKIMNFLHSIIVKNYEEKMFLKKIHSKELTYNHEIYPEKISLIENNILKWEFIAFISKHAALQDKKQVLSMLTNAKSVAYIHALLSQKTRCLNFLQEYIKDINSMLSTEINGFSVVSMMFGFNLHLSIKHIIKHDYKCSLKPLLLPHFLNSVLNLEVIKKILKKYYIELTQEQLIYLTKIHSSKFKNQEAIFLFNKLSTQSRNSILYSTDITSNLYIWTSMFACDNKLQSAIASRVDCILKIKDVLNSNISINNKLYITHHVLTSLGIFEKHLQSEIGLGTSSVESIDILDLSDPLYNELYNNSNMYKIYHKYHKLLNWCAKYFKSKTKELINSQYKQYCNYINLLKHYTDYNIGDTIFDYL
jgi:hypothetical protein